jgi:tetratricopeptide (TPR) repeat protein
MRSMTFCALAISTLAGNAQDLAQHLPDAEVEKIFHEGELASRKGNYDKAIALFTQVIERDPQHINAFLQRGFSESMTKHYELAVADFTAVINLKNDHLWAYTSRGSAYNKLGRQAEAMADFDKVLSLDPKDQEAYNNRGWSKKALGDLKGACKDWKTSKKLGNGEAAIILKNNDCK